METDDDYLPERSWGVVTPQLGANLRHRRRDLSRSLSPADYEALARLYVRLVLIDARLQAVADTHREDIAA